MNSKVRAILGPILHIILYVAVFVAVYTAHGVFFIQKYQAYHDYMIRNIPVYLCVVFAVVFLLYLLISYIQRKVSKGRIEGIIKAAKFRNLKAGQWALMGLIGVACTFLYISVMQLSWVRENTDELANYVKDFGNAEYFIYVILGVGFFAVVFEEFLFRGIVFTNLRKIMPAWATVIIGSIIYGYFQPSPWVGFVAFFLSVLYSLVYMRTQSLWGSIAIGVVVNCLMMITERMGVHDAMLNFSNDVLLLIGLFCLSVIGISLAYMWKGAEAAKKHAATLGKVLLIVVVYYGFLQILVIIWESVVLKQYPDLAPYGIIGLYTNALLSLPLFYFIYKWFYNKNLISITGFRNVSLKVHVMNILLAVSMAVWVMSLFSIPEVKAAAPGFENIVGFFLGQSAMVFFSFFLINSLYKEVLFRALLFNEIKQSLPLWAAMLITGVLYGILFSFADIPTRLYGMAGAVIFGMLYVWFRSIWVTYINELVLFSAYYIIRHYIGLPEDTAMLYVAQIISSIAILALMYGLWKSREPGLRSRRTENKLKIGA